MTAQAIRRALEIMELRAAPAERMYAQVPTLRATAQAVGQEEKQAFTQGGWDAPPTLFFLREHVRSGRLYHATLPVLTEMLRQEATLPSPAQALARLARVTEIMRARMNGDADPAWPAILNVGGPLPWIAGQNGDLFAVGPGYQFHGVGFTSPGWMGPPDGGERIEAHHAYYAGRDGWAIEVWRIRGNAEVPGARYSIPSTPHSAGASGAAPEALTRLCNAIAANPVPVRQ